jgi:hypothetical protein
MKVSMPSGPGDCVVKLESADVAVTCGPAHTGDRDVVLLRGIDADVPVDPLVWMEPRFDDEDSSGSEVPRHRRYRAVKVVTSQQVADG